jgi:hypothetical protein
MPNRIRLDGLDDIKAALRDLPATLRDDAAAIVHKHADDAAASIRDQYPLGNTGNLRAGVRVEVVATGPFGVKVQVRSTAKIAWIYENGTEFTRYTRAGHISRGRMPAGKVVIPTAIRERGAMFTELVGVLERAGLTVHGG